MSREFSLYLGPRRDPPQIYVRLKWECNMCQGGVSAKEASEIPAEVRCGPGRARARGRARRWCGRGLRDFTSEFPPTTDRKGMVDGVAAVYASHPKPTTPTPVSRGTGSLHHPHDVVVPAFDTAWSFCPPPSLLP